VLGFHPYLGSLVYYGFALENLGRGEQSEATLARLEALQEQTKDGASANFPHQLAVYRFGVRGDGARALAEGRLAFESVAASSNPTIRTVGGFALAQGLLYAERWQEAIETFRELRTLCRDHRVNLQHEPDYLTLMAEAQLGAGDWRGALESADEALGIAKKQDARSVVPLSEIVRARAWLASRDGDGPGRAEAALARAEVAALESKARIYVPQIHEVRAEIAARRGDGAARERELREAEHLFREIGWPQQADRVTSGLRS
jgi:tetratricopeptide (TPR) repeat protein